LCWLTVEQQFIPALAIASAVKLSKNPTKPYKVKFQNSLLLTSHV